MVQQAAQDQGMQMSILKLKDLCYGTVEDSGGYHDPLQTMQHDIERVPEFIYLGSMQTSDRTVQPLPAG